MYPLALFLVILVTTGTASAVYGHPAAAGTPAARFWEEALPGTPMPEAIANLIQQGIDHSPLVEHFTSSSRRPAAVDLITYSYNGGSRVYAAVPPGFFFLESQVSVGSAMTVSFEPAAMWPPILPRDVAQKVPFSNLADVLATFHIAASSAEATTVGETVSLCGAPPPLTGGEQKACATSLEDTVESATHMLVGGGSVRHHGVVLWAASSSASAVPPAAHHQQQPSFVVQAVASLDGDRHVGCHAMPFPYAVYYCHMTGRPSKAYAVSLRGLTAGGSPAVTTMAAICHLDTSNWDPAHPAFEMLRTRPGGAPVCHFMSYASLLFGEKAANA
ncbi:hypothetical protein BDA96_08G174000 [Sorghum bicolor]|uniref:BURP domain-containing protein n=2 Tax=Sorghum bicolor TaxID=4558 RepID=A0A921QIQ7_SORBI|nr:BURP domain-containing protein 3 [Sorghum bicolor]KAG0521585.1 hypothetical protein BDA96_08G174000 [Sorghum bicolor]KAG0521586.1 hypothetical protein BDA96_08G174000 [Sorghum bicolor]KXG23907.1 hypothetical protein SORBI_3008G157500 [Sorghum bicolor]|eukprot:XP_021301546.1 BURP domain-containing protein 3 [Sorghum bicolor]